MKPLLAVVVSFMLLIPSACNPQQIQTPSAPEGVATAAFTSTAEPILIQSDTAIPSSIVATLILPATETMTVETNNEIPSTREITREDNGRTFNMKVGDSFLLHLDSSFYDWSVEVDNQNVLSRELNVTVINGAQGIYLAHIPGTAILSASGNPKCINSNPPCLSPSVTFMISVIVQ